MQNPEFVFTLMNKIHNFLLKVSGNKIGTTFKGMTVLTLTTIGRSSGQPRSVKLTSPIHHGDTYILIASKGGHPDHPQWYKNLVKNPSVRITLPHDGVSRAYTAKVLEGNERQQVWEEVIKKQPLYANYQKSTDRVIPVIEVHPAV